MVYALMTLHHTEYHKNCTISLKPITGKGKKNGWTKWMTDTKAEKDTIIL